MKVENIGLVPSWRAKWVTLVGELYGPPSVKKGKKKIQPHVIRDEGEQSIALQMPLILFINLIRPALESLVRQVPTPSF